MAAPNVLLVTVDCMRRDRLSAYGYERRTTPFLDSILEDSLHCTSAHSTSSWTSPAIASMLTGLYPHHHGAGFIDGDPKHLDRHHLPRRLAASVPVLPQLLPDHVSVAAVEVAIASMALYDLHVFPLHADDPNAARSAADLIGIASSPFFAWVHLGVAHDPLDVPRGSRDVFGRVTSYRRARRWAFTGRDDDIPSAEFERYRSDRVLLYDAAIREADAQIAALWASLGDERDRTVLVVTADHGEELWEHRDDEIADFEDPRNIAGAGHGQNLWQEILLVPLIVRGPGIGPRRIDANVSLADVAPTILEAVGADIPADVDGQSLLGDVPTERRIIAEGVAYGYEKAAVIEADQKLLSSPGDGYERVFELGPDRREAGVVTDAGTADRLRGFLPGSPAAPGGAPIESSEEIERHLRDLGYIE